MIDYPRRTFLKTSLLAAAATVTTPANGMPRRWNQGAVPERGVRHPFFAQAKNPDVIAHRGGNGQWPGETVYAMKKAQKLGCDVLEMDVYLTKDRELILMHDIKVHKTTSGSGHVYDFPVQQITALRADSHWSPDCETKLRPNDLPQNEPDLNVPTIKQVLETFPKMRMVIEMKRAPKQNCPQRQSTISRSRVTGWRMR